MAESNHRSRGSCPERPDPTLPGSVPERRMKHAIEDIIAGCRGVIDAGNGNRVGRGAAAPLLGR